MRGSLAVLVLAGAMLLPSAALADVWEPVSGTPPASLGGGATAHIQPDRFRAYTLDDDPVAAAPAARSLRASTTLTLPAPNGELQRFSVTESPIMEPGLAARHPEITTWAGRGIDDPAATIRADRTPLGFHASVRAPGGAWYVDPYYHLDDSVYITYYGRDLTDDPHGRFVEAELDEDVNPLALAAVPTGPEVIRRTYRLALLTDPGYSNFFGGPQNVTAAKVTLMNRVNQIYEDETAIRLVLIADNDKLNLDTPEKMTGPNGPCGAAPCYVTPPGCTGGTLNRTRIVIGQIIGASNYDIGHIGLGTPGGGVASLGVVGGNLKAQGCTGLSTPVGDVFAVDYVAHEMGHQFGGPHTFNGTQRNCSGGNRSAASSVEPGSGSSIMAYAGICDQDNLQPHSDPYWSQRSFENITAYVTSDQSAINEVQTASLRDFDGTDSFRIRFGGSDSAPIVRGTNYTTAGIQLALQGASEVQTFTRGAGPFTLGYLGADTVPIVPGQNDTALGIQNALQGGNEQQAVTLTGFNQATQSFQVQIGGATSEVLGAGGLAVSNANVAAAINAIPGFAGTVTSGGAGNGGFTLTFSGASAGVNVPPVEIVNCTCTASVRENAQGGQRLATWPAGGTVAVSGLSATGFTLTFSGGHQGTDVALLTISDGTAIETVKGTQGSLPTGVTATVAAWGGTGALNDTGFQVTFGSGLANTDTGSLELVAFDGASGFVGETARGGPVDNKGRIIEATGNHAPVVETAAAFTIPVRTPFALTGSATDFDGDTLTYMWEQNDRGSISGGSNTGIALVNNVKTSGPLFRQFGTAANVTEEGTLLSPSPGLNGVDTNPTREFPDMAQILANNTNAVTATCPPGPTPPTALPPEVRECFSEFLPTADWIGFLGDRTMNFRLTVRDGFPGAGGIGSADTKLTLDPDAGPFLVTSQGTAATLRAGSTQTVTWNVAGTNEAPVGTTDVKISLLSGEVLAASTPNDGSADVTIPNLADEHARIKVEAVGNVFFDVSDADLVIQAAPEVEVTNQSVQYSDAVSGTVVKASDADTAGSALTATATGLPAGLSLADGSTAEHARTWTLVGNVTAAPGTYAGSVTVTDGDGEAITKPLVVTVKPEDAVVTYLGDTLSSGKVLLRARLMDADDGAPGDIGKATVTFKEGTKTLCTSLSCTVTLANGTHAITVEAGGYYMGSASATVRVAKPTKKVNAIGLISHFSTVFAIDNKYAEIVYAKDGRAYRISADEMQSIGFSSDGKRAEIRFKADLWDHTKILRPVRIGRGLTLQVSLSESGRGSIAFSLWDGDTLVHDQPERTLAGGFVEIR